MFSVKAWNNFAIVNGDETGRLVVSLQIEASNVTRAMDEMERLARNWNKDANEDMQVNFITCKGFIRAAN